MRNIVLATAALSALVAGCHSRPTELTGIEAGLVNEIAHAPKGSIITMRGVTDFGIVCGEVAGHSAIALTNITSCKSSAARAEPYSFVQNHPVSRVVKPTDSDYQSVVTQLTIALYEVPNDK